MWLKTELMGTKYLHKYSCHIINQLLFGMFSPKLLMLINKSGAVPMVCPCPSEGYMQLYYNNTAIQKILHLVCFDDILVIC